MSEFPTIEPITIPNPSGRNLRLVAMERVPLKQGRKARNILRNVLGNQLMNSGRAMTDLCSERNNNAGCDLSLGVHNFVVFTLRGGDPDEVIGAWNFYDIEIENEGPASMRISSKCMPGVRAGPGLTRASTWSLIMVHLLENDMTLRASGKTLNLVQWDFPGQPLDHRWDDTGIVAAVTQQLRDTHPVFTRPDGSLIRIRQTGAPAGGGGGAGRRGGG